MARVINCEESYGGMLLKYKTGNSRVQTSSTSKVDMFLRENNGKLSFEFDKSIAA